MNVRKAKTDMKVKAKRADGTKSVKPRLLPSTTHVTDAVATEADELIAMIEAARVRVWTAVNSELVMLYWNVGKWLSRKCAMAEWGDKTILSIS